VNPKDLKLIASFYASPMFRVFDKMIEERIEQLTKEEVKRDSQFDTIYNLGLLTGRKKELTELLKTLEMHYRKYSK